MGPRPDFEKKRKELHDSFQAKRDEIARESSKDRTSADRFVTRSETIEDKLRKQTYGLVQLDDFKEARANIEEQKRREAARTDELAAQEKKRKRSKLEKKKAALSFAHDDEEDTPPPTDRKLAKNPDVDTSFLPDRDREEAERKVREELRQEWLIKQEQLKQEDMCIICSYWDGSGHRAEVTVKKGDSIGQFLEKARREFPQIKSINVDNLLYVLSSFRRRI